MTTTTIEAPASTRAPRIPKASRALLDATKLLNERLDIAAEKARLFEGKKAGEARYDRVEREIKTMENARDTGRWRGDSQPEVRKREFEDLQQALKAEAELLAPIYEAIEELEQRTQKHGERMRKLAREALQPATEEGLDATRELAAAHQLQEKLEADKAALLGEIDPVNEDQLSQLEKLQLRLSVLPGYITKLEEKLTARNAVALELWKSAKPIFAQLVAERQQQAREYVHALLRPLFPADFDVASEFHVEQLVRKSIEFTRADGALSWSVASVSESHFQLSDAQALLASFDALAALPPVPSAMKRVTQQD